MATQLFDKRGNVAGEISSEGRKVFLFGADGKRVGMYETDYTAGEGKGFRSSDGGFLPKLSGGEQYADWASDENDHEVAEACGWLSELAEKFWGYHMVLRDKATFEKLVKRFDDADTQDAVVQACITITEIAEIAAKLYDEIDAALNEKRNVPDCVLRRFSSEKFVTP